MSTPPDESRDADIPADGDGDVPYEVSSDDRTWGILVHAAGFVGLVIPLGNVLAPLLIWAIKKDGSRFVDENGKQAVNFQITWTALLVLSAVSILAVFGLVLFPIVALAWLVLTALAVVKASNDTVYEYPLTLDLVS